MSTAPTALRILLIEDSPGDAGLIRRALLEADCPLAALNWVETLAEGRQLATTREYDAALLDLSLPDSAGLDTVRSLRAAAPSLPIVVLTGFDDMGFALAALEAGAQDYLVKGEAAGRDLIRSVRYARERQSLEAELERSRERFRSFAEAGSDWLWETDAEHRFTYLSEAFESITGFPPSNVLGKCRHEMFSSDISATDCQAHLAALERREGFKNFEYPLDDGAGGLRFFRVSGTPVFSGDRFTGYRGVGADVTRFKMMGQELRDRLLELEYSRRQMEEQAAQMAQLAEEADFLKVRAEAAARAKADFLATMSHEIRTPMTGVLGMVDLLLGETLSSRQKQFVETIKEAGETLLTILNDILDISKLEAGRLDLTPEPTDLRVVAESVRQLFGARAAEHGLELRVEVADAVPGRVMTDGHRLRQVLFNLVGNAVKFTESGSVTLGLACEPEPGGERSILRFSVTDTGPGVAPDALAGLFTRFQQADQSIDRKFGGTGLGLALCKAITEMMGGTIGVESELGKGSRFFVSIPMKALTEATASGKGETKDSGQGALPTGLRLLVAEDNRINQMLLREILGKIGEVVVASNGQEAVDAFAGGGFHAIVMDVRMPVMGGLEAIRLIRATPEGRATPILALSADVMPEHVEQHLAAGADASLGKPIDMRKLIVTIATLIANARRREC
ncbi:MAG: response regulator [Alphaproteobacteria bacterium]|nr:response regulator [Alphaproteobacteria bacterium]